jgi:PAS domain-containing protein
MSDTQIILYVLVVFPVFFTVMWLGITGMLAAVGGWSELAQLYREPEGTVRAPVQSFRMATLDLRRGGIPLPANYSNCAIVELAVEGLHLRTWAVFRFRHPPLLIPWTQIEQVQPGRVLFFRVLTVSPRGVGTRIRMYGAPADAVEHAWRQLAAPAAQPVPV